MKKNVIIAQSGGPTCVINSSLRGCIEAARNFDNIGTVFAARHGIEGVLKEELLNLSLQPNEEIELLRTTPVAGSIGTCRYKLKSHQTEDFERVIEVMKAHNIGYFLYIGAENTPGTGPPAAACAYWIGTRGGGSSQNG